MKETLQLDDLQQWFYDAITHINGVEEGAVQSTALNSYQAVDDPIVAIIKPSETLTAADRLAIYRNAYFLRLKGVFEAEYPVLKFALGEELFEKFVLYFIQENPPQSYTLHELSSQFVAFLKATQPEEDRAAIWPSFLMELASIERIFQEVYQGSGTEGESLKVVDWNSNPSLRLMKCVFPVHLFIQQFRQFGTAEMPAEKTSYLAIYRQNYKVLMKEVTAEEYELNHV